MRYTRNTRKDFDCLKLQTYVINYQYINFLSVHLLHFSNNDLNNKCMIMTPVKIMKLSIPAFWLVLFLDCIYLLTE